METTMKQLSMNDIHFARETNTSRQHDIYAYNIPTPDKP